MSFAQPVPAPTGWINALRQMSRLHREDCFLDSVQFWKRNKTHTLKIRERQDAERFIAMNETSL